MCKSIPESLIQYRKSITVAQCSLYQHCWWSYLSFLAIHATFQLISSDTDSQLSPSHLKPWRNSRVDCEIRLTACFNFHDPPPDTPLSSVCPGETLTQWQYNAHPAVRCSGRERMVNWQSGWSEKNRNVFDLNAQWPYLSTDLTRYAAHNRSEYSAVRSTVRIYSLLLFRSDLRSE